eukprot:6050120-Amphidinium_carterae.7
MIVAHHQDEVSQFLGARQHGVGMSNGIATFAKKVAQLAEASPDLLFIQSDIANVFGTVHCAAERQRIISARGLQQGDPLSAMAFAIVMEQAFRDLELAISSPARRGT